MSRKDIEYIIHATFKEMLKYGYTKERMMDILKAKSDDDIDLFIARRKNIKNDNYNEIVNSTDECFDDLSCKLMEGDVEI